MSTPIQSLNLTRRATNALLAEDMTTVEQVDEFPDEHWRTGVAKDAYMVADAMLAARKAGT